MTNQTRMFWLAVVAALGATASTSADDTVVVNRPSTNVDSMFAVTSARPTSFDAEQGRMAEQGIGARPATAVSAPLVRRLPPVTPQPLDVVPRQGADSTSKAPVDGTWREDGQHVIINLNGQELKLEKTGPSSGPASQQKNVEHGEVYGRLSDGGLPLVDCVVALIPLTKTWNGYGVDGSGQPLRVKTDDNGVYHLAQVPTGPYKLSWLPEGERQWIRRISFRPDVRVRVNKTTYMDQIRVSLRTIN